MKTNITEYDNNYLTRIYFNANKTLKPGEVNAIAEYADSLSGIEEMVFLPDKIVVSYYSHLITGDYIRETLVEAGYPMAETDRRKKSPVQRFLERIAESNQKARHDAGPACCRLR